MVMIYHNWRILLYLRRNWYLGKEGGVRSRTDRGSGILEMRVSSLALSSFILHQVGRGNTNQFTLCSMVVKRGCTGEGGSDQSAAEW